MRVIDRAFYHFVPEMPYAAKNGPALVQVVAVGTFVHKCRTEAGQTFAAFTSELHFERGVTGRGEEE
jgi:hypothetical protein